MRRTVLFQVRTRRMTMRDSIRKLDLTVNDEEMGHNAVRRRENVAPDSLKGQPKFTVLVTPASPGSLGDEAMLAALTEELQARGVSQRIVATWRAQDDWQRAGRFDSLAVLPHGEPADDAGFSRTLDSAGTIYTLGADVLDGAYDARHSLILLRVAHFAATRGLRSIVAGCSFRTDARPEVLQFLRGLDPRVTILARDEPSQILLQEIMGRQVPLVADIAFLLKPAHESAAVSQAAEWISWRRRVNGGPVIGCNLNPQPLVGSGLDPNALVTAHVEAFRQLSKRGEPPFNLVILPHDWRSEHRELEAARALYRALPAELRENALLLEKPLSAGEIKAVAASLDVALTGRMHFAIAVLGNGKPAACLSYHPKFAGLLGHFALPEVVLDWREALVPEKLAEWLGSIVSRRFELTTRVVEKLPAVLKLARANLDHDLPPNVNGKAHVNGFKAASPGQSAEPGKNGAVPVRILAETAPESWGDSNGGWRRSIQLHQIIARAGIELQFVKPAEVGSNLRDYVRGMKFLLRAGFAGGCNPRLARRHGVTTRRLGPALATHTGAKLLIWEVTCQANQAVPFLARQSGFSVIALPHNLETLAAGVPAGGLGKLNVNFAGEAHALKSADAVFTISSEERWLLALQGVVAEHLPYFPAEDLAARFLEIRTRRRGVKLSRLLVLGTAWNPPTMRGMTELIGILRELPGGPLLPVDIAGFGTEQLQPLLVQTAYRLHGSVSENRLDELMLGATAIIAHQTAASGALTRVPEMLLAGIPVIANGIAARSHAHLDGVHVYDSPEHLHELISHPLPEPERPARPIRQEQRLVETLRRLVAARKT